MFRRVPDSALQPCDFVICYPDHHHVGMYVGNNTVIHAPHTGTTVQFGTLAGWYSDHYSGATRIS